MQHASRSGAGWPWIAVLLAIATPAAAQVTTHGDPVGRLLNLWFNEGSAAGLARLSYENRDGGHSRFNTAEWPQLRVYEASEEEKKMNGMPGAALAVRPLPLFGNASMSASADKGGSIPRLYETNLSGLLFLAKQYFSNNLFFYPSHQDHLFGWNGVGGWGDLYPINHPYLIVSQGSSGTDQPFIRAFVAATAALQPDTQRRLISTQLLVPVLQSLFRQSNKPVRAPEDYFTGAAHPPVFAPENIDEERFVRAAHNLTSFAVPPMVILEVKSEDPAPLNGRDFFELPPIKDEKLTDTPCAIGRIFRGRSFQRHIVVSARRSTDIAARPLELRWVLLQGDSRRVQIQPSHDGLEAGITVAWHPEMISAAGLPSHRVDIGVFAGNGLTWSPPAFVTFYMLPNELRHYREDGRLEEICYETGNPHLGLPASDSLRWLTLGRKLSTDDRTIAGKLLRESVPETAAKELRRAAGELAREQKQWRELNADTNNKPQADAARRELETAVRRRIDAKIEGGPSPREAVEKAIAAMAEKPDLFTSNQEAMVAAVQNSGSIAEFAAAKERAIGFRVIHENKHGRCVLAIKPSQASSGDIAALRDFHLSVLALALFPEFLERSSKPAFVDARLTTPKPWRDLPHYDSEGKCTGWKRIVSGKEHEFDAEGRLLPDGPGGRAAEVKFLRDDTTGHLLFAPK